MVITSKRHRSKLSNALSIFCSVSDTTLTFRGIFTVCSLPIYPASIMEIHTYCKMQNQLCNGLIPLTHKVHIRWVTWTGVCRCAHSKLLCHGSLKIETEIINSLQWNSSNADTIETTRCVPAIWRHPYFRGFWYIASRHGTCVLMLLSARKPHSRTLPCCTLARKANQRLVLHVPMLI